MKRTLDGIKVEYLDAFGGSADTQCSNIMRHMQEGHRIDGMKSLRLYGCNRLPARIIDIQRILKITVDRDRIKVRGKWYMEYYMRGASNNAL